MLGAIFFAFYFRKKRLSGVLDRAQKQSRVTLEAARKEADKIIRNAMYESKNEAKKTRRAFELESKRQKIEIQKQERKNKEREQKNHQKIEELERIKADLREKEKKLLEKEQKNLSLIAESELLLEKYQQMIAKAANMSIEEAKHQLIETLEEEAQEKFKSRLQEIEEDAQKKFQDKALEIIALSTQRIASDYVNDATVTVVSLPSEDMKGRIIGREGRNIRSLEQATGVDVIIDDTPEAVIISCFNPIRREIAKITLEKLIDDGRIHPARIEETAQRIEKEFDITIREYGEQAAFEVGIADLNPELVYMLGKLHFRLTGKNHTLKHCVETSHICGMMAAELNVNVKLAKRAGLLHDIGKALDQDSEGHHADLGYQILKKHGESDLVLEAVKLHHAANISYSSSLAPILQAANELSNNRPGARKEAIAGYIKRLESIESLIMKFPKVDKVYALQSGREVRVLVTPEDNSDENVKDLAFKISTELKRDITYPGQIQLTIVKESKYVAFAS